MRSPSNQPFGLVPLLTVAASCGSVTYEQPPAAVLQELDQVDMHQPVVQSTPIVDIHTHTYSGSIFGTHANAIAQDWVLRTLGVTASGDDSTPTRPDLGGQGR